MKRFWGVLVIVAALAPAAYLAWTWRAIPHLGLCDDDAVYWVTAKSWAQGRGYRIAGLIGEPVQTKYPPVYPLLLAAVWKLNPSFPGNLPLAMLLQWLLLPALIGACWLLYAQFAIPVRLRILLCSLLALNPILAFFSATLMSEIPFTILLVAAVIVAEKAARGGRGEVAGLAAGVLAGLAYLTRSAALPMLCAGPLYLALRGRHRQAALFIAGMGPAVAGWLIWIRLNAPGAADLLSFFYTDYARFNYYGITAADVALYLRMNVASMTQAIGDTLLFNPSNTFASVALARVLTVGALAGAIRLGRGSGKWLYQLFALLYLLMILAWTGTSDPRFVLPLAPLMLAGLAREFAHLVQALRDSWNRGVRSDRAAAVAVSVALGAFLVVFARQNYAGLAHGIPGMFAAQSERLERSAGAFRWISERLRRDTPVIAFNAAILYLHTEHPAASLKTPPVLAYRQDRAGFDAFMAMLSETAVNLQVRRLLHLRSDSTAGWEETTGMATTALAAPGPGRRILYSDRDALIVELISPR